MSGAITIQIQDTGDWTLAELQTKLGDYAEKLTKTKKRKTTKNFFGVLNLKDDPLNIQKEMRGEW